MTNRTEVLDGSDVVRIRGLMADVVDKSSKRTDACVYRGEPKCYPRVSSGLFRACPDSANEAFDIARVEEEMVADARRYTTLAGDEEILTEIQHFAVMDYLAASGGLGDKERAGFSHRGHGHGRPADGHVDRSEGLPPQSDLDRN